MTSNILESSMPGFTGLTTSASSLIKNLLEGNPSSGPAQNQAARFGVSSGMPGSGVSNAFGYDLYNRKSEERKQRGYDDLLKMITGYGLPAASLDAENNRFAWQQQQARQSRSDALAAQEKLDARQAEEDRRRRIPNGTYRFGGGYGGMGVNNLPEWNPSWS